MPAKCQRNENEQQKKNQYRNRNANKLMNEKTKTTNRNLWYDFLTDFHFNTCTENDSSQQKIPEIWTIKW